jgi:hypothetical protein
VKRIDATIQETDPDAALERIKSLEEQLALTPVNGRHYRTLLAAIRVEAGAYRRLLDFEQATALHDRKP